MKIGNNELEVSGDYDNVMSLINKVLPYLMGLETMPTAQPTELRPPDKDRGEPLEFAMDLAPTIVIKKGEPLTSILKKMFDTDWGHKPRPLKEITEALNSYGLYYPKSTIAVTLNRLSQRGVVRRIKTKEKYYLYVSAKPIGGVEDE
jgi:hypothetical protein